MNRTFRLAAIVITLSGAATVAASPAAEDAWDQVRAHVDAEIAMVQNGLTRNRERTTFKGLSERNFVSIGSSGMVQSVVQECFKT